MNKELTLQEAALAWAQGKRVEARPSFRDGGPWDTISPVGHKDSSRWPASILNDEDVAYKFRLAPEPPAKKWRPWTPEEVPLDAWFKAENGIGFKLSYADLWTVIDSPTVANANGSHMDLGSILKLWKHSIDNGKTWLPCGVEVEA